MHRLSEEHFCRITALWSGRIPAAAAKDNELFSTNFETPTASYKGVEK